MNDLDKQQLNKINKNKIALVCGFLNQLTPSNVEPGFVYYTMEANLGSYLPILKFFYSCQYKHNLLSNLQR